MGANDWRKDKWLRSVDRDALERFLDYAKRLLDDLGLGPADERYSLNVRNDSQKSIGLVLRDRFPLSIIASSGLKLMVMLPKAVQTRLAEVPLERMPFEPYSTAPEALLLGFPLQLMAQHQETVYPELLSVCKQLLARTGERTRYRKHHIGDIGRMVFEPSFREQALDFILKEKGEWPGEALGEHRPKEMERAYYCVGTYWHDAEPKDRLPDFRSRGVWENGYDAEFTQVVKGVPVGSMLAAKKTYTRMVDGKTTSILEIIGMGEVTGNAGDGKTLQVKWEETFKPFTLIGAGGYRSTIGRVNNAQRIKEIFIDRRQITVASTEASFLVVDPTVNRILYGPPGTGKTYRTVDHALAVIEEREVPLEDEERREDLRLRFEGLLAEERIRTVTFHQAMSYEDFIEGIKPHTTDEDGGDVIYRIEDGIFKRMAIEAAFEYVREDESKAGTSLAFSELFDDYVEEVAGQLEQGKVVQIPLRGGRKITVTEVSSNNNLYLKHDDGKRHYTVSKSRAQKLFAAYPVFEAIPNIYKDFRRIIGGSNASAYWAVLNQLKQRDKSRLSAEQPVLHIPSSVAYEDKVRAVEQIDWRDPELKKVKARRYVLVIDEINRGNVAGIFGELITLIEPDKRAGATESAQALLPYSKAYFSVPPNLYILGTMNTADRSVEALDTALRRRFIFVEMQANVAKVEQPEGLAVNLSKLLSTINGRVERLLDKDHHIGHSYFMGIETEDDLRRIFKNKVLPLLEEYFYGDPRKVGAVLGKAWVKPRPKGGAVLIKGFGLDDAAKEVFDVADATTASMEDFRSIYV